MSNYEIDEYEDAAPAEDAQVVEEQTILVDENGNPVEATADEVVAEQQAPQIITLTFREENIAYQLTDDIFVKILGFLDFQDLMETISLVSQQWSSLAFHPSLWNNASFQITSMDTPKRYLRFFGALPSDCFKNLMFKSLNGPIPVKLIQVFTAVATGLEQIEFNVTGDKIVNEEAKCHAIYRFVTSDAKLLILFFNNFSLKK